MKWFEKKYRKRKAFLILKAQLWFTTQSSMVHDVMNNSDFQEITWRKTKIVKQMHILKSFSITSFRYNLKISIETNKSCVSSTNQISHLTLGVIETLWLSVLFMGKVLGQLFVSLAFYLIYGEVFVSKRQEITKNENMVDSVAILAKARHFWR